MGERTAFFYGTLMVPQVLHRVTGLPSISHLKIAPAILPNHSRRHVRYVDYPGMIPHAGSSVRGTYVTGLTDKDVDRLDLFEGGQYKRVKVRVQLLSSEDANEGKGSAGKLVEAETYIFKDKDDLLETEWDYEEFKREKMDRWVGQSDEYDDLEDDDCEDDEDDEEEDDSKDLPPSRSAKEKKILESAV